MKQSPLPAEADETTAWHSQAFKQQLLELDGIARLEALERMIAPQA